MKTKLKQIINITLAFVLALLPALSQAKRTHEYPVYRLSLEQCINLALKNNEEIKAAHHDIAIIAAKKIEATKRYLPVFKYKYRIGPVPKDLDNPTQSFFDGKVSLFNSFKLEVGAPISTFGRIKIAQYLADLGVDLKKLEAKKKSDEIILTVYKLYNGILLARELRSLVMQGLDAVEKKIKELEKDENTDQIQILKLKVILYEAERKLNEAITKEALALATLKVQMGLEQEVDFDIKDKSLKLAKFKMRSFEDILKDAKNYRPEYKLLKKGVQARLLKYDLEKREYLPTLGIGGYGEYAVTPGIYGDEDSNDFTNPFNFKRAAIGFELSGTLDFRKTKSKIKQAKAEYLKMIAQKRAAFKGLEIDLKKAYTDLKSNRYLLTRAEKDKKAARQIVFLTKSNLDIGLGDKKDYLDALQSYLLFQGRAFESIFNYNNAVATLRLKMGQLYYQQKNKTK